MQTEKQPLDVLLTALADRLDAFIVEFRKKNVPPTAETLSQMMSIISDTAQSHGWTDLELMSTVTPDEFVDGYMSKLIEKRKMN